MEVFCVNHILGSTAQNVKRLCLCSSLKPFPKSKLFRKLVLVSICEVGCGCTFKFVPLICIHTYSSCFAHVALVSGHVWDNVVLNTCPVKSVFTCFGIMFSQLIWRASCCSDDVQCIVT